MAKVYETGNKNYVIRMACRFAIYEREEMIDGYIPHNRLWTEREEYIRKCKSQIRDFKKLIGRSYP